MVENPAPVEPVPYRSPVAGRVVAHLAYVGGTGKIGFGCNSTAIGMLAHSVDVGNHDPVIAIDKHLHEPSVDFIWVKFAKEHESPECHEPFNMVAVAGFFDPYNDVIDGRNSGGAFIKRDRDLPGMFPAIGGAHCYAEIDIGGPHKFPPANNLPDKSFQRIEWDFVALGMGEGGAKDLFWSQEPDIQHGGQYAVPEPVLSLHNGILIIPEKGET